MPESLNWEAIAPETQSDLNTYATAAMQALLTGKSKPTAAQYPTLADTAWEVAEAMFQRRTKKTFRFWGRDEE